MSDVARACETFQRREALTIARILKVNHAGEHGAIRIYRAQCRVARHLYPDMVATLSEMMAHEIDHHARFQQAMQERAARPCRMMWLLSVGGRILGLASALGGRSSIWTTTAAVEAAVHRHLDDQLAYLGSRDKVLFDIIASIREEELSHLNAALAHLSSKPRPFGIAHRFIAAITDMLIWMSTSGDASRMKRDLATERIRAQ